ncbi:hypothetical protein LIER_00179 [Lithospermum erythrorhizon]|uniref:Uncharacterized protein n=1 Tax=Lithospermum erythrorhizon TaxID=34254 RepID=A0AAV3NGK6_LITER
MRKVRLLLQLIQHFCLGLKKKGRCVQELFIAPTLTRRLHKLMSEFSLKHFVESFTACCYLETIIISTRIAFVEFVMAERPIVALSFSSAILGSLPVRLLYLFPSQPRSPMH